MGRTRRRGVPRHDDPQRINRLREELGLYRLYLDDYFGYNAARALPTRGSVDPDGTTFDGLPGNRLAAGGVGTDEMTDGSLTATKHPLRNVAGGLGNVRALPTGVKVDTDNVVGELGTGNIPNLGAGKIDSGTFDGARIPDLGAGRITSGIFDADRIPTLGPGKVPGLGNLQGKVKAHSQIDWGSGAPPVPAGKVGAGYKWEKIKGKPQMSKYLTRADFRPDGTLKR